MLTRRNELLKLSCKYIDRSGYQYKKKRSRSKYFESGSELPTSKRPKNHPWWNHPCGVHLGTHFLESVRLARVPYDTVSNGDSSESLLTPLSAMEITPHVPTRWRNTLSPSGMTPQPKRSARMTYSSLPYDGTLASLTLSRKRVPQTDGSTKDGSFQVSRK